MGRESVFRRENEQRDVADGKKVVGRGDWQQNKTWWEVTSCRTVKGEQKQIADDVWWDASPLQ